MNISRSSTLSLCYRAGMSALKKNAEDNNKSGHGNGPKQVGEHDEGVSDWSMFKACASYLGR